MSPDCNKETKWGHGKEFVFQFYREKMKAQQNKTLCRDDPDWPEYSTKLARKRIDKEDMRTLMKFRSQMVAHCVK